MELKYVGLDDIDIDAFERKKMEDMAAKHAEKLKRLINNEFEAVLQFKAYNRSGDREEYSVHLRIAYPGGAVTATKEGWNFTVAVKEVFEAVEQQFKHRFRE